MKYVDTMVTFSEIPDEVTLCINISKCPHRCEGCHSPHLREDIGETLDFNTLKELLDKNKGVSCICFMGGDAFISDIFSLAIKIQKYADIKVAWYSGSRVVIYPYDRLPVFDYLKIGPYIKDKGGLNNPNTNQKLFKLNVDTGEYVDITCRFWLKNKFKTK